MEANGWDHRLRVVADVSTMPFKFKRDARELKGHRGEPDKTIHSTNISKNLEDMQMTVVEVCLRWPRASHESRTHDR